MSKKHKHEDHVNHEAWAIPYGDHHPWIETHEDNGKCGMTAVLFNLLGG